MRSLQIICALLLGLTALVSGQSGVDNGTIIRSLRTVSLTEPDLVLFTNQLVWKPSARNVHGRKTIFEYVVASDYQDTLMDIEAFDGNTNYPLEVIQVDQPLSFDPHASGYNSTEFIWFQIDVTDALDGNEASLEVSEYHKKRREAFPQKLSLSEK